MPSTVYSLLWCIMCAFVKKIGQNIKLNVLCKVKNYIFSFKGEKNNGFSMLVNKVFFLEKNMFIIIFVTLCQASSPADILAMYTRWIHTLTVTTNYVVIEFFKVEWSYHLFPQLTIPC